MNVEKPIVLCDPDMPPNWKPREATLALELLTERDQQIVEPEIVELFRRAALL